LKLLYFAWLRTRIGRGEEEVELPPDVKTVGDLIAWLRSRGPGYAAAFAQTTMVRAAVDQDYAGPDQPLGTTMEVAFFPPVTGGIRP
jgi:molybdopterin synthase sulfur carrier subunit